MLNQTRIKKLGQAYDLLSDCGDVVKMNIELTGIERKALLNALNCLIEKEQDSIDYSFLIEKLNCDEVTQNTILKIKFEENLSDNSIMMIKNILSDSLGFKTEIRELEQ